MAINYTYKIEARPEQMFVRFTYSADGKPDTYKNLNTVTDFSEANLKKLAEQQARGALDVWSKLDEVVVEDNLENEMVFSSVLKDIIQENIPEGFDEDNYTAQPTTTEDETTITYGFELVELTEEQKIEKQIYKAKSYLASTDWVAAKLAEAEAGIITSDIKTKYADVFIAREEARALINSLEG